MAMKAKRQQMMEKEEDTSSTMGESLQAQQQVAAPVHYESLEQAYHLLAQMPAEAFMTETEKVVFKLTDVQKLIQILQTENE